MDWPLVILVSAVYVAVMLYVAFWVGGLLQDAERFLREPCACRKGAVCEACEPERSHAA